MAQITYMGLTTQVPVGNDEGLCIAFACGCAFKLALHGAAPPSGPRQAGSKSPSAL